MPAGASAKVPVSFEDVAVRFSQEEWEGLEERKKELYKDVMKEHYQTLRSLGTGSPTITPEIISHIERGEEPYIRDEPGSEEGGTGKSSCSGASYGAKNTVIAETLFSKKMAKRKKDEAYRTFQQEWTEEFAFVERAGSPVCLICNDKIASMKRSNIKRHFETRHATFASEYPAGDSRKKACQELLCRVPASQQPLRVCTQQGDWISASFAGALAIVRNGKPFTDGEYAKTFMLDVANELFDDFLDKDKIIKRIKAMPLSARTIHDRTIMMANQIEATQVKDIHAAPFFSLALSQFSVIARYAVGDTLREESLAVLPMKGATRGEDLFKSFTELAKEKNLPMDKLISVCTDGAPCMVGKNRGFVALLREHEKRPILSFHCILHQEALCAQMCGEQLGEVMSLVIRVVNFIVARALNDRQFKTLLDEVGNNYPGLLLHSNVRWLSRGKVLSRFAACLSEIRTFLEMKNVEHPELANTEWLLKFYYLVDMTEHLNQLNGKMQGVGNTVLALQQAVFAFENKLELFIADIETGRLLHFEKLGEFKDACTARDPAQHLDLQQLVSLTSNLLQSFKARFEELRERTRLFKFITHPLECAVDSTDLSYIPGVSVRDFELQAADLKASDMWVNKFKSLNEDLERLARQQAELASKHKWGEMKKLQPADQLIVKTWNALPVTYHTLQRVSVAVLTMFGSTYACEQSFSHLKNIKTNLRSRLTDGSLNACMKLNLTTYQPDYKAISRTMQHQKSH
ncbi:protein FAM200A-like isoform X1 [Rhinatrema bivittatum]|uniref:protein FAM200A-like isoform X1 n=1 Tax=Rhinatrema bivittatum TaxID=194408 RepID=UPI001128850B|nr:protein FAM200A-like isoform X1 [Rhinatrema bivittatum]XP_029448262.1 protein FAM200A-like isoform X1 [Rhinatrema bivittatum]XP_029448263.1 protein FAM200A-like isoform X1 [Rhinatrema bivittatum]